MGVAADVQARNIIRVGLIILLDVEGVLGGLFSLLEEVAARFTYKFELQQCEVEHIVDQHKKIPTARTDRSFTLLISSHQLKIAQRHH